MKIVFRLSALGFGGTERVFIAVADYLLDAHGWQSTFVVDKISNFATEDVAREKGHQVVGLDVPRTWKSILPFARFLRNSPPDIIISAYTETNGAAILSSKISGSRCPVVVTEHASLNEHWSGKSRARRWVLDFIVGRLYRLSDSILCVSAGLAKELNRRQQSVPVIYIHNPVRFGKRNRSNDEARQILQLKAEDRMILAVGRISRQKNYLMLARVLSKIKTKNTHLYIVGGVYEKPEKIKLDLVIADLGLSERVHFIDFTHDVSLYYEAAELLVLSSSWEGFGNVIVEALAFGLPIVSTNCNYGPSEILADGKFGRLIPLGDADAMASAVDEILELNPFPEQNQIHRAEDFSEAKIGRQYYDHILRTVGAVNG